jgi:tRNA pseudouridine38-40 synthase
VQGVLEDALSRLIGVAPEAVATTVAGRTDAGVHAEAQVVHVDVPVGWPRLADLDGVARALGGLVGPAVAVRRVRRVPASFDARRSATGRRYRYRLFDGPVLPPLWRHDTWQVLRGPLDVAAMHRAGQVLVGEHDYASFCRRRTVRLADGREVEAPTTRRIDRLSVRRSRPAALVLLRVDGAAFCHQMVRSLTGTLVEVGLGRRPVGWVAHVLAARDRTAAGRVAPPHGLSLVGVRY